MSRPRLGIVVTHPIQYQAPLYRHLASRSAIEPIVFFLSEHGLAESFDPGFGRLVQYDVPMLGGYEHQLVRNRSPKANLNGPWGVLNPSLPILIRHSHVDAVLVHGYSKISHWFAYGAASCFRIPYLLRGESRPDRENRYHPKLIAKRAVLRPLIRNAAACLAIGEDNRNFYRSYGAQPQKIFFAPYSVDTERFSIAGARGQSHKMAMLRSLGLDPEIPVVLFAAKLQPRKRPVDVVMAMDQLTGPANLIVIGDGPLRTDIEQLASERPWMRALGFINQTEIAEWYGAADLFVLPSSHEPWGLSINEAMAAGSVPIVSNTVGCATDLVKRDVGWVYPTGNVSALTDAIMEGCQEGALNARRAAAQRRSAEYGIASTARGIEMAVAAALGR